MGKFYYSEQSNTVVFRVEHLPKSLHTLSEGLFLNKMWLVSIASRYGSFSLSDLYLPGESLNESISEIGTPLRRIQLPPDVRMIMRMMASRADL